MLTVSQANETSPRQGMLENSWQLHKSGQGRDGLGHRLYICVSREVETVLSVHTHIHIYIYTPPLITSEYDGDDANSMEGESPTERGGRKNAGRDDVRRSLQRIRTG